MATEAKVALKPANSKPNTKFSCSGVPVTAEVEAQLRRRISNRHPHSRGETRQV